MVISGGNRGLMMIEVGAISLSLMMKFLRTFEEVVRTELRIVAVVALLLW